MPISIEQQRKFLSSQFALFYPRISPEEQKVLDNIYTTEFTRLFDSYVWPTDATKAKVQKIVNSLKEKAKLEQHMTLDAWVEGGLIEFRILVIRDQAVPAEWRDEAIRRSGWQRGDTDLRVVDTALRTDDDIVREVHGLIVVKKGKMTPRVDRLVQIAIELGLKLYVLDIRRSRIRKIKAKKRLRKDQIAECNL